MRTNIIVVLSVSILLCSPLALGKSSTLQIKKDFDFICATQKKFSGKAKEKGADPAALAYKRSELIRNTIKSDEAKNTVNAVSVVEHSQKRALIEKAAQESGLKGWTCPVLDSW